ncbi:MAG: hypothetical protein FWB96_06825 [Defluviitaleaceae bacterium]|nr:hypothetical protein [Defluviitaleaceae bacterium]MCL2262592.1 hypothetical protein [Defluviitaleaceae bacterium]
MEELNTNRIKEKFYNKLQEEKSMKHKKTRFFAIVAQAAILSVMSVSVFAAYTGILDFSRIYQIVFGENSEYIEQHIQPLNHESGETHAFAETEYNGIAMRLISAINDESTLRIFAAITDTIGDKWDTFNGFDRWGLSQGHTMGTNVVEYCHDTRTAIILITSHGYEHHGDITLSVDGFVTDTVFVDGIPGPTSYNVIEGRWELSFTVPNKISTEFRVEREIQIDGVPVFVEMVALSPLGVTVHLPKSLGAVDFTYAYSHNDTAFVEHKNGNVTELNQTSIHGSDFGITLIFSGQIIEDIANVQSIVINGERIYVSPLMPITANGMKWALGVDENGNEVLGWVREIDLELGSYYGISLYDQMDLQRQRTEIFYETEAYQIAVNLYSDEYATEKIGTFIVIAYPAGQEITHGHGGVMYDRPE